MKKQYIGKLVYDQWWGLGTITAKKDGAYQVWWYDGEWYGEVNDVYIDTHEAKKRLDSSDGRAVPL